MSNPKKKIGRPKSTDGHVSSTLVRIDSGLYAQVQELAAKNERPAKWELERAIRAHLAASAGGAGAADPRS